MRWGIGAPGKGIAEISAVAAANLAAGTPVVVSRQNGQLLAGRADTYVLGFVAGLLKADTVQGFVGTITDQPLTLTDWSTITGQTALQAGQSYYLAPTGGLITAPNLTTKCCVRVGLATSAQTMMPLQSDPILL